MAGKIKVNGKSYEFDKRSTEIMMSNSPRLKERLSQCGALYGPEYEPNVTDVFFTLLESQPENMKPVWTRVKQHLNEREAKLLWQIAQEFECAHILALAQDNETPESKIASMAPHRVIWAYARALHHVVITDFDPVSSCPLFKFNIYDAGYIVQLANSYNRNMEDANVQSALAMKILKMAQTDPQYYFLFQYVRFTSVRLGALMTIMKTVRTLQDSGEFVVSDMKELVAKLAEVRRKISAILALKGAEDVSFELGPEEKDLVALKLDEAVRKPPDDKEYWGMARKWEEMKQRINKATDAIQKVVATSDSASELLKQRGTDSQDVLESVGIAKITCYPKNESGDKFVTGKFDGSKSCESEWPYIEIDFSRPAILLSYTLKCIANIGYLTNWILEARAEGDTKWTEIDRQVGEWLLAEAQMNMEKGKPARLPEYELNSWHTKFNSIRLTMNNCNTCGLRQIGLSEITFKGVIPP